MNHCGRTLRCSSEIYFLPNLPSFILIIVHRSGSSVPTSILINVNFPQPQSDHRTQYNQQAISKGLSHVVHHHNIHGTGFYHIPTRPLLVESILQNRIPSFPSDSSREMRLDRTGTKYQGRANVKAPPKLHEKFLPRESTGMLCHTTRNKR